MKSVALLLVFLTAKAIVVWPVPISATTLLAYGWQDFLIVLLFGRLDAALRTTSAARLAAWALYWLLVAYASLNLVVGRALSTPLTWPMIRAAGAPLTDSFAYYATFGNVLLVLALAGIAALPLVVRVDGMAKGKRRLAVAGALLIAVLGAMLQPRAEARQATRGLDRNVVVALVESGLPHVLPGASALAESPADWRHSPFDDATVEDLAPFRSMAAGRNILMVSLESTAAQYLATYGATDDVAPHLTALSRNAIVFENAYTAYPESIKGLFSILCARYPAFDTSVESFAATPCRSLPAVAKAAGYQTALFHSGRFGYLGMDSVVRARGFDTLEDAGDIGGEQQSSFGVDEPATVARILTWIDGRPRSFPFFVTYLPVAGHHPYESPLRGPFPVRDELGRYKNALRYADAALGTLLDGLRQRGMEQSTAVIVFGDHGEAFGQHLGNYGHTFFLYDENVHVPFIVSVPDGIHGQRRVRRVLSLVDTAPTVLDLIGLPIPDGYDGRSAFAGPSTMALFFADYSLGMLGLRDREWKFIYELRSGRSELFNLDTDAREQSNLAGAEPDRVVWYRDHLLAWSAAQKRILRGR